MRGWIPGILIACGAALFLVWGSLAETDSPPRLDARSSTVLTSGIVASVTDGDTIRLADNRRVRLVQIDAPERPSGECYAERATSVLTRLAPVGDTVSLRLDRALDARDEHGRVLAYVTSGKQNLNLEIVELGAAAPYFFRGKRGQYAEDLMRAAMRAKAAGRGLWGACPGTTLDPSRPVNARK
ncbi:MAG: thermonuclease family protein [Gaiellaceae bacterium]